MQKRYALVLCVIVIFFLTGCSDKIIYMKGYQTPGEMPAHNEVEDREDVLEAEPSVDAEGSQRRDKN